MIAAGGLRSCAPEPVACPAILDLSTAEDGTLLAHTEETPCGCAPAVPPNAEVLCAARFSCARLPDASERNLAELLGELEPALLDLVALALERADARHLDAESRVVRLVVVGEPRAGRRDLRLELLQTPLE